MKPENKRKCLLLGGAGFIGAALSRHLLNQGYDVTVVSRTSRLRIDHPSLQHYHGSLDDLDLLNKLLPSTEIVYYLASDTTPISSANEPGFEIANNVAPAARFIETARHHANFTLIYFSSGGTVYGNTKILPAKENNELKPISNHGAAKVAIEAMLRAFGHQSDCRVIVLRLSECVRTGTVISK